MPRLNTQKVKFNQVSWVPTNGNAGSLEIVPLNASGSSFNLTDKPSSVTANNPYWQFSFQIGNKGIEVFDISVHDSQGAGTHEQVIQKISYDGFEIDFEGGGSANFDFSSALSRTDAFAPILKVGRNGAIGTDHLFQKGIYLKLYDDLAGQCPCEVELSVVFRGAMNDNDPAGAAMVMKCWPEVGFLWKSGGTKRVSKFRATVKPIVRTQMFPGLHAGHHGSAPVTESVANFFTDRNAFSNPLRAVAGHNSMVFQSGTILPGALTILGPILASNFPDWANIFDSRNLNISHGKKIRAVYGPLDGANAEGIDYFSQSRERDYLYASGILKHVKAPRQGYYDNTHIHGKMSHATKNGDVQSHAPFCIHSCMHIHWRWSESNVNKALLFPGVDSNWFKGWSSVPPFESNSTRNAPLIPPNQSLKVSITHPNASNSSDTGALDVLNKLLWYEVEIQNAETVPFDADTVQVIFSQGMGWAFKFGYADISPLTDSQLSTIFHEFYDLIRYFDTSLAGTTEQIPDGSHSSTVLSPSIKMEEL
ncbi:hypothetical protein ACFRAE_14890 [Sphingobacterium sp. HJSM2_6]|uniref:hypothetical protein n=1 Tax=Sphingobacterium sp. HJSM2_6 TaxID=3366264 RepID=UPI003BC9FC7F